MMIRSSVSKIVGLLALAPCALSWLASPAVGQLSADPYKPWNAQYEAYVYPSYPTSAGIYSNSAAYSVPTGRRPDSRFEELDEDEDLPEFGRERSEAKFRRGIGVPYTHAYRRYDRLYDRVYTPNKVADESFNEARQLREEAYLKYRSEKDPKERVRLRKEYDDYNRQTLRELMLGGRSGRGAGTSGGAKQKTSTSSPAPPASGRSRLPGARSLLDSTSDLGTSRSRSGSGSGYSASRNPLSPRGPGRSSSISPGDVLRRSESMGSRTNGGSSTGGTLPPRSEATGARTNGRSSNRGILPPPRPSRLP